MQNGYTPKTAAVSTAITLLHHAIMRAKREDDLFTEFTPAFRREAMRQLIRLHNRMLDASDLNGLHIEDVP